MNDGLKDALGKPRSLITIIVVASVLFAGLYTLFAASGDALPAYIDQPPGPDEPPPPDILATVPYRDGRIGLTVPAPEGWQRVTKDGFDTFVHPGGTSMQIQVMDYSPSLNMADFDSLSADVSAIGGHLSEFLKTGTSSYAVIYNINETSYVEYSSWCRLVLVRLRFTVANADFGLYIDTFRYIIDSLEWERIDPIPPDFVMYYSEHGNFEFGVPASWGWVISGDGVFTATNPQTGAVMHVSVTASDGSFHGVSQIDYVSVMSANRGGFLLQSFANDGFSIAAEATYFVGDEQYGLAQHLASSGRFEYAFSFEAQMRHIHEDIQHYRTAVALFRFA